MKLANHKYCKPYDLLRSRVSAHTGHYTGGERHSSNVITGGLGNVTKLPTLWKVDSCNSDPLRVLQEEFSQVEVVYEKI
jgi:hypothetical protein